MHSVKTVDMQGRIILPKKWRDEHLKNHSVLMEIKDGKIILESYETEDISDLIDSVEVDIKSDLSNWKEVKRELFEKKIHNGE